MIKERSNTVMKAIDEFKILKQNTPDAVVLEFETEILNLVDKFGHSGQSGGSAPFVASAIRDVVYKLCMQEPIIGITCDESEWMEVGNDDYQNTRCSGVFKHGKTGRPYFLDAITWVDEKGHGWHSNHVISDSENKIYLSRQYIKSLPFIPKNFRVDVISKEVAKDDWEFYVKNSDDLKEVFEYYDEYEKEINT
jgi:hypothetical protein